MCGGKQVLSLKCVSCNVDQVTKIGNILDVEEKDKEKIMRLVLSYLSEADFDKTTPEVMKGTWDIITAYIDNKDPYKEIKEFYNMEVLAITHDIEKMIDESDNQLNMALKAAITGNLIDFGASHQFDEKILIDKINKLETEALGIDDSSQLMEDLSKAKILLYLGDNCGEIVLDKVFIKYLKIAFPKLRIVYGVRGETILNDVTTVDAKQVGMYDLVEVMPNGNGVIGTVLPKVSKEFRQLFEEADVVIAKGQGNFESLYDVAKENLYFLFMAKCEVVAQKIGTDKNKIVCVKQRQSLD